MNLESHNSSSTGALALSQIEAIDRITRSTWKPSHKVVATRLIIAATPSTASVNGYAIVEATATSIAREVNCSPRTAAETLSALVDAGLIEWRREVHPTAARNRYGEDIPINRANVEHGDFIEWQHTSTIAVQLSMFPSEMPTLSASQNVERARASSRRQRARVQQLQDALNHALREYHCPHCDSHSTLDVEVTATCSTCGSILDAAEIDALLSTPAMPTATDAPVLPDESVETNVEMLDDSVQQTDVKSFHDSAFPHSENFSHGTAECTEGSANLYVEHESSSAIVEVPDVLIVGETSSTAAIAGAEIVRVETDVKTFHVPDVELDTSDDALISAALALGGIVRTPDTHMKSFHVDVEHVQRFEGAAIVRELTHLALYPLMFSKSKGKVGLGSAFLDAPLHAGLAVQHLEKDKRTHTVGILADYCDVITLDVDAGFADFLNLNPRLASAPRIVRQSAPERAKILIALANGEELPDYDVREIPITGSKGYVRKIELLSTRRHAIVAGAYADKAKGFTGEQYQLETRGAPIPTMTAAEILAIVEGFIPASAKSTSRQQDSRVQQTSSTSSTSSVQTSTSGSAAKKAIRWWLSQPSNIANVLAMIEALPHEGQMFSIRPERTPSCKLTSADAVHDYGTGAHLDLFDVYVILNKLNKRAFIDATYKAMVREQRR